MIPLETLDHYMLICGVLGVTYVVFMLGILFCFLKKYSCGTLSGTPCQQIELHPVAQPYQYTAVTQSSDSITHSYATRSNHSFSSKHSSHVYCNPQIPRIPCVRLKPDLSQMERLATL